jgi:hypothetical protein
VRWYEKVECAGPVYRDVLVCTTVRKLKQLKRISKDVMYFDSKTTERYTVCGSDTHSVFVN